MMRVGARLPIDATDRDLMSLASTSSLPLPGIAGRGAEARLYDWGGDGETVALVHGWQGRAAQFAPLVRRLRAEGFRVVTLDAPAHGDAPGRRTYLFDWVDAIRHAHERIGTFHALIGHSFGGLAARIAVGEGVGTGMLVAASSPADLRSVFGSVRALQRYGDRTAAALERAFSRRYFSGGNGHRRVDDALARLPRDLDVLVAHGIDDRRTPFADAERIVADTPGSHLLALRGVGHSRILGDEDFLAAATGFVTASRTTPADRG